MTKARDLARVGSNAEYGLNFRNRIINGDMRIDQRNNGASVTIGSGDFYTTDRWMIQTSQASKLSAQQNAGSVTPPAGFVNYLGSTSLAATSIGSGDYFSIQQRIEGFNVADLAWGTASAKTITVSFWVRSSLTGTFGGSLRNGAGNRSYPFTYTISSTNTWEQKTVTIAGDTTGTWLTTNGIGITLAMGLGVGSTFSGTAGAWASGNFASATGATSVVGTSGATFYITGVQLEVGSSATPFESRPYGTELALCQRYFERSDVLVSIDIEDNSVNAGNFKVTKRASPTVTIFDATGLINTMSRYAVIRTTVTGVGNVGGINSIGLIVHNSISKGQIWLFAYTAQAEL